MLRASCLGVVFALSLVACPQSTRPAGTTTDRAGGEAGVPVALVSDAGGTDASAFHELPALTEAEVCKRPPAARVAALAGKKPFTGPRVRCGGDPFCDVVEKAPDPKDACFVANDNLARAEREARADRGRTVSSTSWDGTTPPKFLDRIDAHFHFTPEERDKLKRNGFVVLDRLAYTDYASAFHDVFQEELPLFVGVDAILHAVFRGTELALERVERKRLVPALAGVLKKLRGGLPAIVDAEARGDPIYLAVAAELARGPGNAEENKKRSALKNGDEAAIGELLALAGKGELADASMFGRVRKVDFSQLVPRGHYSASGGSGETLEGYFRAVMWLSRLEFNLVSRSSRSSNPTRDEAETPREVKAALALAELVERTGASVDVRAFDDVYTTFAGRREDVPVTELSRVAKASGIASSDAEATTKLKAALGTRFERTARTHFTVEGAPVLPVITTLLGPRIVPDVAPLTRLVHDAVPGRFMLGAGDVGYVLGHDRGSAFIPDWTAGSPLASALAGARTELAKNAAGATDVYGTWLKSVLALAEKPGGVVPSFVGREAYADHRLNSALVGYGQIRHAFVLLAAQGYDAYGCEIPDAYVEPLPAVYDALLAHVRRMRSQVKGWEGLERVLAMLASVAHDEVSGRALGDAQKRWLAMVSEHIPIGGYGDSGEPPKWTGWYFDMFEDREHGAAKNTSFIADYFTLTNAKKVAYLGAEGPRLAVFVVDTNGEPRAMVGPVAKGFETTTDIAGRLDDEASFKAGVPKNASWRTGYAALERPVPALGIEGELFDCSSPNTSELRVAIRTGRATPIGPTHVTILDHHGDVLTPEVLVEPKNEWAVLVYELPATFKGAKFGVEAVHVRVDDLSRSGAGRGVFDFVTSPSVFAKNDPDVEGDFPRRPRGAGRFAIGVPGREASVGGYARYEGAEEGMGVGGLGLPAPLPAPKAPPAPPR